RDVQVHTVEDLVLPVGLAKTGSRDGRHDIPPLNELDAAAGAGCRSPVVPVVRVSPGRRAENGEPRIRPVRRKAIFRFLQKTTWAEWATLSTMLPAFITACRTGVG
ncbi:hypothetical protein, partial [Streptomyces sp. NPDC002054]|uniref:hypothetical protein n=1 Tax=Streptomyces sp. NPDC002054 TaxID=3154663 RepID=UPI00331750F9